jgi:anhydro-N-acetylmuramic acid kinase
MTKKLYRAIGLMSGTSMDGVDLAMIESDGRSEIKHLAHDYLAYGEDFKKRLSALIYKAPSLHEIKKVENELTLIHAQMVNDFVQENSLKRDEIDVVAFHGHTIAHDPQLGITWQIGNGHLLAERVGIGVVADFRTRDVACGGQGAPLVPIYHFHVLKRSAAMLNIGGISNITSFVENDENSIEAFDVCFGNAPFDDLMRKRLGRDFDNNGEISLRGQVDFLIADRLLQNEIFHKKPPKSFDRDDFSEVLSVIAGNLKLEDALATFAYIHAKVVGISLEFLSHKPREIFVCGGGRKNEAIMQQMHQQLQNVEVKKMEDVGLNGDTIEAEAFAFLGIRHLLNLPISFRNTTGVGEITPQMQSATSPDYNSSPVLCQPRSSSCGGVFYRA